MGRAEPAIRFCEEFFDQGCHRCSDGFAVYLSGEQIKCKEVGFYEMLNCAEVRSVYDEGEITSYPTCQTCKEGFHVETLDYEIQMARGISSTNGYIYTTQSKGRCVLDHCQPRFYNFILQKCSRCDSGYTLTGDGRCVKDNLFVGCSLIRRGQCWSCEEDFHVPVRKLNGQVVCEPIDIKNCRYTTFNYYDMTDLPVETQYCTQCESGFNLTGQFTEDSGDRRYLQCVLQNCAANQYNRFTGKCSVCEDGYVYSAKLDKCLETTATVLRRLENAAAPPLRRLLPHDDFNCDSEDSVDCTSCTSAYQFVTTEQDINGTTYDICVQEPSCT